MDVSHLPLFSLPFPAKTKAGKAKASASICQGTSVRIGWKISPYWSLLAWCLPTVFPWVISVLCRLPVEHPLSVTQNNYTERIGVQPDVGWTPEFATYCLSDPESVAVSLSYN